MEKKQRVIEYLLKMTSGELEVEFEDWNFYNHLLKRFCDELTYSEVCDLLVKVIGNTVYVTEAENIVRYTEDILSGKDDLFI